MSYSPFYDTEYPSKYFEEYLTLIEKYRNITRPAVFVKYYNLNIEKSIFREDIDATYSPYSYTGLVYDIYEYTPLLYINGIQNSETFDQTSIGKTFPAMTSATIYTIKKPNINDLIQLYKPYNEQEIFRVSGIRLQTGIVNSPLESKVNFFELDLEYAGIDNTDILNVNSSYIYDISQQKNVLISEFTNRIKAINDTLAVYQSLYDYYNRFIDIYCSDNYAPCYTNELIIMLLDKYNIDYNRVFEVIYKPYKYDLYYKKIYTNIIQVNPDTDGYIDCYNLQTNTLERLIYPTNYSELNNLIQLTNQFKSACESLL